MRRSPNGIGDLAPLHIYSMNCEVDIYDKSGMVGFRL